MYLIYVAILNDLSHQKLLINHRRLLIKSKFRIAFIIRLHTGLENVLLDESSNVLGRNHTDVYRARYWFPGGGGFTHIYVQ